MNNVAMHARGRVAHNMIAWTLTLKAGDATSFPGMSPHTYGNTHRHPTRFSLAVFEPAVGTQSQPRTGTPHRSEVRA